jgi:hypothetical protein
MSEEGSQTLTGYIKGNYIYLNYGNYYGVLDMSNDIKYFTENYESIIACINNMHINNNILNNKSVLRYEILHTLTQKQFTIKLSNASRLNQIVAEQYEIIKELKKNSKERKLVLSFCFLIMITVLVWVIIKY